MTVILHLISGVSCGAADSGATMVSVGAERWQAIMNPGLTFALLPLTSSPAEGCVCGMTHTHTHTSCCPCTVKRGSVLQFWFLKSKCKRWRIFIFKNLSLAPPPSSNLPRVSITRILEQIWLLLWPLLDFICVYTCSRLSMQYAIFPAGKHSPQTPFCFLSVLWWMCPSRGHDMVAQA